MIFFFFFNDTATTEIYTLSLHDALPISFWFVHSGQIRGGTIGLCRLSGCRPFSARQTTEDDGLRSEEHTSELQSPDHLVCRLLLEKKKTTWNTNCKCTPVPSCTPHLAPP